MDAIGVASNLIMYLIILLAVVQDFFFMKISNRLIGLGLAIGLGFRLILGGPVSIVYFLVNILFPVIALYLFFLMGAIGPGDIKLFSVIGAFVNFKQLVFCIAFSFVIGAIISLGKMIQNKNLQCSIFHAFGYFQELMQGRFYSYNQTDYERKNLIHFSMAICIGAIIARGGM